MRTRPAVVHTPGLCVENGDAPFAKLDGLAHAGARWVLSAIADAVMDRASVVSPIATTELIRRGQRKGPS